MTAKEAKFKTLWYRLPISVRNRITSNIEDGSDVCIVPADTVSKMSKYYLDQLGYRSYHETLRGEDYVKICW